MKYLRVTARPDPERAPAFFGLLADSAPVQSRLVGWNFAASDAATLLYAVGGDAESFRGAATDTAGVESVDVAPLDDEEFYALVRARPDAVPLLDRLVEAMAREGLVVIPPVVYGDGCARSSIVGDPATLQSTLGDVPGAIDVTVQEIGAIPRQGAAPATALSDRQREAVVAALELGYYDQPRRATQEDVADRIDAAPSTAGEHLRRAEAKLVESGLRRRLAVDERS